MKRYSSGQYLRLAFAVAAHLEPDILLIDEVLAVGDAEFQQRCLGALRAAGDGGRTVVFVVARPRRRLAPLQPRGVAARGPRPRRRAGGRDHRGLPRRGGVVGGGARVRRRGHGAGRAAGGAGCERGRRRWRAAPRGAARARDRLRSPRAGAGAQPRAVPHPRRRRARDRRGVAARACGDRDGDAGAYRATMRVPPILHTGGYALGVWIGTAYDDLVDEEAVLAFTLEGLVGHRASRVVNLGSVISVCLRRVFGLQIAKCLCPIAIPFWF